MGAVASHTARPVKRSSDPHAWCVHSLEHDRSGRVDPSQPHRSAPPNRSGRQPQRADAARGRSDGDAVWSHIRWQAVTVRLTSDPQSGVWPVPIAVNHTSAAVVEPYSIGPERPGGLRKGRTTPLLPRARGDQARRTRGQPGRGAGRRRMVQRGLADQTGVRNGPSTRAARPGLAAFVARRGQQRGEVGSAAGVEDGLIRRPYARGGNHGPVVPNGPPVRTAAAVCSADAWGSALSARRGTKSGWLPELRGGPRMVVVSEPGGPHSRRGRARWQTRLPGRPSVEGVTVCERGRTTSQPLDRHPGQLTLAKDSCSLGRAWVQLAHPPRVAPSRDSETSSRQSEPDRGPMGQAQFVRIGTAAAWVGPPPYARPRRPSEETAAQAELDPATSALDSKLQGVRRPPHKPSSMRRLPHSRRPRMRRRQLKKPRPGHSNHRVGGSTSRGREPEVAWRVAGQEPKHPPEQCSTGGVPQSGDGVAGGNLLSHRVSPAVPSAP